MLLDGQSDDAGAANDVNSALENAGAEGQGAAPEPALPPAPEPPREVAITKPKTRRERAEEKIGQDFASLASTVRELRDGMSARDRQIGELTGHLTALAQQRPYQAPQQAYQPPAPQLPDPEELERKAMERLDAKDMTGYQRYTREAGVAATLRALQPVLARQQQMQGPQQQEQMPAGLMPYFAAYPEVASHPKAMELLAAKNVELDARGFRPGPERVRKIFDEVKATLTAGQSGTAPAYSQASAGALSGVPTSRPSAGGNGAARGEPRVQLTAAEQYVIKRLGQNEDEIARIIAESHPERIVR